MKLKVFEMCRMLIAIGCVQTEALLQDLCLIASGNNELHEKNPFPGFFKHADGWGIAFYTNDNKWHNYRSTKPIYDDKEYIHTIPKDAKVLILHARKATSGEICLENTQPIAYEHDNGKYFFVHNGTINWNNKIYPTRYVDGDSDTVAWFNFILTELFTKNSYSESIEVDRFTSANFFLVTPDKIVIGQKYKVAPMYSTMKMLKEDKSIIISSEILPNMKDKKWVSLENNSLMEFDIPR